MKKTLKRLSAFALAAIMVLAMSSAVFAATTTNGVATSSDTTVTLDKTILVFNANGSTVYNPGITYSYSVAPATVAAGTTVTDSDGDTAVVQAGPTGGVSLTDNTAVFSATATTAATSTGKALTDTITASVDLTKFSKAGIYRYLITEAVPENLTAVGITRPSDYYSSRYLDVYVKNGTNGLEVYGYVCFIAQQATTINGKDDTKTTIVGKTTGFVESYTEKATGTTATGNLADRYYTYDLTLEKEITGDLADMTNQFPFTFASSNAVTGQKFTASYTGASQKGSITGGVTDGVAAIGTDITAALGNGGKITIKGLPANTKFNITETNNTADTYKVTISGVKDTDNKTETSVAASGTHKVNANAVNISTYATYNDGTNPTANYSAVKYTNKLDSVSPTGVMLRFGPYILILAAGIAIFALSRRRRV